MSRTLLSLLVLPLLLLLTPPAEAQSLDGKIERNPDDTVTYTIDIDGPPRGQAFLYLSLWVLNPPFSSPSLGTLYLDPFYWLPIGPPLPLPPSGQQPVQFTVPQSLTAGLPVVFQTFNLDPAGTLRLSANAMALAQNEHPPCNLDYAFSYDTQSGRAIVAGRAPTGATVTLQIVNGGNVRHQADAIAGNDGKFLVDTGVPGQLQDGDVFRLLCNGQPIEDLDLHR